MAEVNIPTRHLSLRVDPRLGERLGIRCARWGAAVISRTVDVRFPADLDVPNSLTPKAWYVA